MIEVLQDDFSLEHQRELVTEALPSLEAFMIIGRRAKDSKEMHNFVSCSFEEHELASALLNLFLNQPSLVRPFAVAVDSFFKIYSTSTHYYGEAKEI